MLRKDRPSHISKVRREHVRAIRELYSLQSINPAINLTMVDNLIGYHIRRLHNSWFSSSRREKQR